MASKDTFCPLTLLFFILLPDCHEMSSCAPPSPITLTLLHHRPQTVEPGDPGLERLPLLAKQTSLQLHYFPWCLSQQSKEDILLFHLLLSTEQWHTCPKALFRWWYEKRVKTGLCMLEVLRTPGWGISLEESQKHWRLTKGLYLHVTFSFMQVLNLWKKLKSLTVYSNPAFSLYSLSSFEKRCYMHNLKKAKYQGRWKGCKEYVNQVGWRNNGEHIDPDDQCEMDSIVQSSQVWSEVVMDFWSHSFHLWGHWVSVFSCIKRVKHSLFAKLLKGWEQGI